MNELVTEIATIITAIAAAASAIIAAVALRKTKQSQEQMAVDARRAATIIAFNRLQDEVLDKMVSYHPEDVRTLIEYKDDQMREAYDDCRALIAKCEHFSVGVNSGVYDFDITNRLGGTHLIYLYGKIEPVIEEARSGAKEGIPFHEFEQLVDRLASAQ